MKRRVEAYQGEREQWYGAWFTPLLGTLQLSLLSWESVIDAIAEHDPSAGEAIGAFYERCLAFNGR